MQLELCYFACLFLVWASFFFSFIAFKYEFQDPTCGDTQLCMTKMIPVSLIWFRQNVSAKSDSNAASLGQVSFAKESQWDFPGEIKD